MLTPNERRKWLRAIRVLRRQYVKGKFISCPLFDVVCNNCFRCLWNLIEKTPCAEYADVKFENSIIFLKRFNNPAWKADALARLKRWQDMIRKGEAWDEWNEA